jgi:uncharacterized protein
VIYVDTSVALAHLLAQDRTPRAALWREPLVSSRLLTYEVWNRIHARRLARALADDVGDLLGRFAFLELTPPVLARALQPFPMPVRTLDALHLASMVFLAEQGQDIRLATYDAQMREVAGALGLRRYDLS